MKFEPPPPKKGNYSCGRYSEHIFSAAKNVIYCILTAILSEDLYIVFFQESFQEQFHKKRLQNAVSLYTHIATINTRVIR